MMKLASAAAVAATIALGASAAQAVVITATTPTWSNVVGGTNIDFDTSGGGNNTVTQVFWGNPTTFNGQSGLGFNPDNPPSADIPVDTTFRLGTLTHYNQPIAGGTAASSVVLNLATAITGATPASQSFAYQFLIDETPNTPPCAYPSTTPCADRITFVNVDTSNAFTIGGVPYTIQLLGFSNTGVGGVSTFFDSQEGGNNTIGLYARITTPTPAVPEPMSLALFGLGLAGFGMVARRRTH